MCNCLLDTFTRKIRNRAGLSFKNKKGFFQRVDRLPIGTPWVCDTLTVTGDLVGPKGEVLTEELEIWRRDPVECVRELLGNPAFKAFSSYAPVKVFKGGMPYYSEMNTCQWWWDKQVSVAKRVNAGTSSHVSSYRMTCPRVLPSPLSSLPRTKPPLPFYEGTRLRGRYT